MPQVFICDAFVGMLHDGTYACVYVFFVSTLILLVELKYVNIIGAFSWFIQQYYGSSNLIFTRFLDRHWIGSKVLSTYNFIY